MQSSFRCVQQQAHPSSTGHPMAATTDRHAEEALVSNEALSLPTPSIPVLVDRESWLVVACSRTRLFVYRSVQLWWETDEWYQVVRDLVGDAEPLVPAVEVPDPDMMGYAAEWLVYALSDD